jgi:hypothetical protein
LLSGEKKRWQNLRMSSERSWTVDDALGLSDGAPTGVTSVLPARSGTDGLSFCFGFEEFIFGIPSESLKRPIRNQRKKQIWFKREAASIVPCGMLAGFLQGRFAVGTIPGLHAFGAEERAMCEKCEELDRQIEHYRVLFRQIMDKLTLSGTALLIERYEARKRELHPEQREEWKRPQ